MLIVAVAAGWLCAWPQAARTDQYLLGSSPSLPKRWSQGVFPRLAELLTAETGRQFVYRYTGNWPSYMRGVRDGRFALLFDEPHLVAWRVEHLDHVPLIRLSGVLDFVIVSRDDDDAIVQLSDLAGHAVCADAPPAMDGLILFAQFDNPSRQPVLRRVRNPADAYARLLAHGCRAAMLSSRLYRKLGLNGNDTRVLFLSASFPNWALSADPGVPPDVRARIQQVLLDPANAPSTTPLADVWSGGRELKTADQAEYRGQAGLLDGFWALQ